MIAADLREIVQRLQGALGVRVQSGQITLNFNDYVVQSVQTTIYQRVGDDKPLTASSN